VDKESVYTFLYEVKETKLQKNFLCGKVFVEHIHFFATNGYSESVHTNRKLIMT